MSYGSEPPPWHGEEAVLAWHYARLEAQQRQRQAINHLLSRLPKPVFPPKPDMYTRFSAPEQPPKPRWRRWLPWGGRA